MTSSVSSGRLMVMSIRPNHIINILSGTKTIELRRTRPTIQPGQRAALYATAPASAIVATCTIDHLEVGSPTDLKESLIFSAQVSSSEYDTYFAGARHAVALHLRDIDPLDQPLTLDQIRKSQPWHPPQTWHFMASSRFPRNFQ